MAESVLMFLMGISVVTPSHALAAELLPSTPPTLQERAAMIAEEYGIASTTLSNLIYSESRWNPAADNGYDRGLVQINRKYHPEVSDEEAFDPEFAMRWAAQKIKDDTAYEWVACNCVFFARVLIPDLPLIKDIQPNAPPTIGGLVLFKYPSGLRHVAYIQEIRPMGLIVREANYTPCLIARRFVSWEDPAIEGYWAP